MSTKKSPPTKKTYDYVTTRALWKAVRENDAREVEKLLSSKADPNARGQKTPSGRDHIVSYAVTHGADRALAVLLSRGGRQVAAQDGNTPLHLAAGDPTPSRLACMKVLLARRPNVHAANNKNQTPLSVALAGGGGVFDFSELQTPSYLTVRDLLLAACATRKWPGPASFSGFLMALRRHPPDVWEELVANGASVTDAHERKVFVQGGEELFKRAGLGDAYALSRLQPLWDFMRRHGVQWDQDTEASARPAQAAYREHVLSQTLAAPGSTARKPRF